MADDDQQPDPDDVVGDGQQHDAWTPDSSWTHLDPETRREYVVSEIAEGRWLQLCRQPLDEVTLAVCAAVQACREDRADDFAAVLAGHDKSTVIAVLTRLLASTLDEQLGEGASGDPFWRIWSSWAVERS